MVYSYRFEEGIISKNLSRHLLQGFLGALADIFIGFLAVLLLLRYLSRHQQLVKLRSGQNHNTVFFQLTR